MADKTIRLKIQRQDAAERPETKRTEEFDVAWHPQMNVISALMEIRKNPKTVDGKDAYVPPSHFITAFSARRIPRLAQRRWMTTLRRARVGVAISRRRAFSLGPHDQKQRDEICAGSLDP